MPDNAHSAIYLPEIRERLSSRTIPVRRVELAYQIATFECIDACPSLHQQQNQQRRLPLTLKSPELATGDEAWTALVIGLCTITPINMPSCRKIAPSRLGGAVREKITACIGRLDLKFDRWVRAENARCNTEGFRRIATSIFPGSRRSCSSRRQKGNCGNGCPMSRMAPTGRAGPPRQGSI